MAHKKSSGSGKNGRDSVPKRLGVKCYAGETVGAGSIIIRQRGTKIFPGVNVGQGRDFTLYARKPGIIRYDRDGRRVSVVAAVAAAAT